MDYALHLSVIALLWASLGLSQGLLTGNLGILAVHQASSFAIGAYVAALLNTAFGVPIGATAFPAAILAGLVSALVGGAVSAGRRDEQVIASLCIQIVIVEILLNASAITNGPRGIVGIGWGGDGGQRERALASAGWALVLLFVTISVLVTLRRTRLPVTWSLIRDDRLAAEALGVNVAGARSTAMFLSAAIAGAAGSLFAHYATFIEPSTFGLSLSIAFLAIAVIGRAPSLIGVLSAAFALVLLPEVLRGLGLDAPLAANLRQMAFGLFLVLSLMWRRRDA